MAESDIAQIVKRVRRKLHLSQEALSRLVHSTKGAVQHWERGRNKPDLVRLLALRELCPPGPERKVLDRWLGDRRPGAVARPLQKLARRLQPAVRALAPSGPQQSSAALAPLRNEQRRLRRQIARLERALARTMKQVKDLATLTRQLQRGLYSLQADFAERLSHIR